MNVPFLELSRAIVELRSELDAALAEVLDEPRFVLGPQVEAFERAFAAYCGAEHAVGVASGTDALAIALRAVGVAPGDEVITAANTCVPTVAAIEAAGARPVLVDPDRRTRTLDPDRLPGAITARTRAIVPVHLYGRCAEMDEISAFADERGLVVVEDAAQAHGAEHRGRRAGTLGLAAAFSFYPTKNLGAIGDAGAIVTSDEAVAERARLLRSYGERQRYDSVVAGTNSRLDSVQASVLLVKLRRLDEENTRRRELAARYADALADLPLELPDEPGEAVHAFHLYVVRVQERDRFRAELAARGVETLVHYPRAIHEHPAYRRLQRAGELDMSEQLAREVVSLPLYAALTDAEADTVVEAARAALGAPARVEAGPRPDIARD